ncbi:MAG: hypothetical protein GY765_07655 [bacterium]|nr:hypothetical protein [bacterium]
MKQTFSAFLNVLPATVAVTYVIATGDAAGGAGLKVKLSGLFGLHDLYALVAIPATTGMSKTDRKRVEEMLAPITQSWLNNKLRTVRDLFEKEITGNIVLAAQESLEDAGKRTAEIEKLIGLCRKSLLLHNR